MPIDIQSWMKTYQKAVWDAFGDRIRFIGLQGSSGRGEATEESDIDVVLLLDRLELCDLTTYRTALEKLEHREKICGFVSGIGELENWEKSDLLSFCLDAVPLYGSLDAFRGQIGQADMERCVLKCACDIYHVCCHNYLHERDESTLRSLQKSAFFVLRTKHFIETGIFVKRRTDLMPLVSEDERALLATNVDFESISGRLLVWSGNLIKESGAKERA